MHNVESTILCSDSGALLGIGSYGSAIASSSKVLIESFGCVHGFKPGYFRAEKYGTLAHLRYFYHLTTFFHLIFLLVMSIYYDNDRLVQRINNHRENFNPSVQKFLYTECDI